MLPVNQLTDPPGAAVAVPAIAASERLCDRLRLQAVRTPDEPACVVLDRAGQETSRTTYGELDLRARAAAAALQRRAEPGERALLAFPAGVDFLAGLFGCAYAGIIAVPVPYPGEGARIGAARLTGIVADATASLALTTEEIAGRPGEYGLDGVHPIAVAQVPPGLAAEFSDPGPRPGIPAFLQYTSGSTSEPKGAQISHRNALASLADIATTIPLDVPDDETLCCVSWLPLFHDMGLAQALMPIIRGGLIVLAAPMSFLLKPASWLTAITRYRAQMSTAPNFAYDLCARLVTDEQKRGIDLSCWRFALNGSEPVRSDTLDRFARAFAGCGFDPAAYVPCYGMAESTFYVSGSRESAGAVTVSVPALEREAVARPPAAGEPGRQVVSCGPVAAAIDARIVDPATGEERPPGRVGEIWVAGGNVAGGYWRRPDERFEARLADGSASSYLRTGDLGFRRGGELYVLGRRDDVIVLDGRNHYPQDIELTVQHSHDALAAGRVAAFGYQCDGRTAVAVVAETATRVRAAVPGTPPVPGQLGRAEVMQRIKAAVSAEHQIRVSQVVLLRPAGLPRTTSGKVRRARCRELFLAGELKTW
jgi:acyl-CoA synthetase (AMP-forming)/AMP-acid ligase II